MAIKIKRIEQEYTFKTLLTISAKIRIHSNKRELNCKLKRYNEESLEIESPETDISFLKKGDEIAAYFLFQNNKHTFTTRVLEVKRQSFLLKQPNGLYRNLQREYERIKANNEVKVHFKLKEKRVELNFPRTENYFPLNEYDLPDKHDLEQMDVLIADFRKAMQYSVSENKIIMLRNKTPTTYEEQIMARTGKIIWFPTIDDGLINEPVLPEDILFKLRDYYLYESQEGLSVDEIKEKLQRILINKSNKGIYSQLYCPILYNEYFIGYIYLANKTEKLKKIDLEIVKYVYEFAKILCYSLKVNDYFQAQQQEDTVYEIPIIDISASGLLFAHPEKRLPKELLLHTHLDIALVINKRKININAMIMRKFRDLRYCYFGVRFNKIAPEDFRYLFESIYGKKYIAPVNSLPQDAAPDRDNPIIF